MLLEDKMAQAIGDLGRLGRESVGVFGWLDTTPPRVVHVGWATMVCAMIAAAGVLGRRFDRLVLAIIGAGTVAMAMMASFIAYDIQTIAQGRWILPVALTLPLVAGEITARRWPGDAWRLPPRVSIVVVAVTVGGLHGASLWTNARRYTVGIHGPILFMGESNWASPGGWWSVLVPAVVGLGVVIAVAFRIATTDVLRAPLDGEGRD